MKFVKQFMNSSAYDSLVKEADHNQHAIQLLEVISISIESLIFFKEHNITNRVQTEQQNLHTLFEHIKSIYEEL